MKFLVIMLLCIANSADIIAQTSYYKFVPFIGSEGDGNVVVGPSCPFGMVKPGPDCSKYSNSGYHPGTWGSVELPPSLQSN